MINLKVIHLEKYIILLTNSFISSEPVTLLILFIVSKAIQYRAISLPKSEKEISICVFKHPVNKQT